MIIPVVGIDFGNINSVIAVARNRGIDVICNEVSNRLTPSMVSFGPKARHLGEGAKTLEISNFKNTVSSFKRLLGRAFADEEVHSAEKLYVNFDIVEDDSKFVAAKVNYQGEEKVFTMVQLTAMFFSKLREISEAALNSVVSDVVVSVPVYFTDQQRRALMDACEVAGLNPLRLMNETTAAALGYGIAKSDLPEDKPRHVVFVDIGQSNYSVSVVAFTKGKLEVKGTAYDRNLGGRDFDNVLVNHFVKEFSEKYKIDILSNKKAVYRLRAACERSKKILSANTKTLVNVESLMDDKDVSAELSREGFEELSAPLLQRLEEPLKRALAVAGLLTENVDAIEMIGGSTRIPAIREKLCTFFGKEVSCTLNQDEAVARGCAFQSAILSPTFRVKEFAVLDQSSYGIKLTWETTTDAPDDKEIEIFNGNNVVPCTKMLTFYRKEPFEIVATYSQPESSPLPICQHIGSFVVQNVASKPNGKDSTVKVKARLNANGIMNIEQAHLIEEICEAPASPEPSTTEIPVDAIPDEASKPEEAKKKKVLKKVELPVVSSTFSLPRATVSQLREKEALMAANDKLVADTEDRKNALEEYIYDMRNKLDDSLSEFVTEQEKEVLKAKLRDAEEWLYNEGWDATKSVYVSRLEELQKIGNPIVNLYREHEDRQIAERIFRDYASKIAQTAESTEERYSHITPEEKQKILRDVQSKLQWLDSQFAQQANRPKTSPPLFTAASIREEADKLLFGSNAILNKPKPKKEEITKETPKESASPASAHETTVENACDQEVESTSVPDMEVD